MFSAQIKADRLKESIEALSALVQECRLKLSPDGITVRAVDPANVAMVSLDMPPDVFASFEATEGEIGLDLKKFESVLDLAAKDDTVELAFEEEKHKLVVKMRGLAYTMSLLDPSGIRKEPKIPLLELPVVVTFPSACLKDAVKAAEKISEYLLIGYKDNLYMDAEGDIDNLTNTIPPEKVKVERNNGEAKALFSLNYLIDMAKVSGKAKEVTLELGKDYPLKMKFRVAEGLADVGYMLAPRVESN